MRESSIQDSVMLGTFVYDRGGRPNQKTLRANTVATGQSTSTCSDNDPPPEREPPSCSVEVPKLYFEQPGRISRIPLVERVCNVLQVCKNPRKSFQDISARSSVTVPTGGWESILLSKAKTLCQSISSELNAL